MSDTGKENNSFGNIFSFKEFKNNYLEKAKQRGLSEYYQVLSYNQLMNESAELINKLNNDLFDQELETKSQALLKEFNDRLSQENSIYSSLLDDMRKNIEMRLSQFHR